MNLNLSIFKFVARPVTKRAAQRALIGRNRSRHELQKGRFTRAEVNCLLDQTWHTFDGLVPDVSKEPTVGSRLNVRLAALTLAFLQSLTAAGVERDYAIELIGDTCWNIFQYWGRLGHLLARLSSHDSIKDPTRRVRQDGSWPMTFPFNSPGYLARYVPTEGGLGFDVLHFITTLFSRTQPLIRYELNDSVRLTAEACTCGTPESWVKQITQELVAHGAYVTGIRVQHVPAIPKATSGKAPLIRAATHLDKE